MTEPSPKSAPPLPRITPAELRELLAYDPETGDITWLKPTSLRAKVGSLAGHLLANGHRRLTIKGQQFPALQMAWVLAHGEFPPIDHQVVTLNDLPNDARLCNLTLIPSESNPTEQEASDKDNPSPYTGVHHDPKTNAWAARLMHCGVMRVLGTFATPEEATEVRKAAERFVQRHGTLPPVLPRTKTYQHITPKQRVPAKLNRDGGKLDRHALLKIFDYDPYTGDLYWRSDSNQNGLRRGEKATHMGPGGYLRVRVAGRLEQAHRVVWALCMDEWPKRQLEHINGLHHDNRFDNLQYKAQRTTHSGIVYISEKGTHQARFMYRGLRHVVGEFRTFNEARDAYDRARANPEVVCANTQPLPPPLAETALNPLAALRANQHVTASDTTRVIYNRLHELMYYDPESGYLYWRKLRPGLATTAKPAGRINTSTGCRQISMDGVYYQAHYLAWLYVKGEWPSTRMAHVNGDNDDNRIDNLACIQNTSMRGRARKNFGTAAQRIEQQRQDAADARDPTAKDAFTRVLLERQVQFNKTTPSQVHTPEPDYHDQPTHPQPNPEPAQQPLAQPTPPSNPVPPPANSLAAFIQKKLLMTVPTPAKPDQTASIEPDTADQNTTFDTTELDIAEQMGYNIPNESR